LDGLLFSSVFLGLVGVDGLEVRVASACIIYWKFYLGGSIEATFWKFIWFSFRGLCQIPFLQLAFMSWRAFVGK